MALIAVLVAALALGLAACGDDDNSSDNNATTEAPAATATAPATTPTAPAETTPATTGGGGAAAAPIAVTADPSGALAFEEKTLTATAGKDTFELTNASPVPHNLAIKGNGVNAGPTETISGGGTAELTVTLTPGTYTFYCAVPGHEQAGMKGTLTVQ
jgi:uncharacterized cupredoxin-like copper-binding protein